MKYQLMKLKNISLKKKKKNQQMNRDGSLKPELISQIHKPINPRRQSKNSI
jgi:hypothetical protein